MDSSPKKYVLAYVLCMYNIAFKNVLWDPMREILVCGIQSTQYLVYKYIGFFPKSVLVFNWSVINYYKIITKYWTKLKTVFFFFVVA